MLSISKPSTHFLRSFIAWLNVLVLFMFMAANASAQTKVTYFHNDLSGNPVAASDNTGQIIWRESYRPFGERLKNEAASQTNSQWYTGHRQDADTGLVYMGARHYDPLIGRFLSIDPAGFSESNPHSFNRYAYANNNPLKFVDPDGNAPIDLKTQWFNSWTVVRDGLMSYSRASATAILALTMVPAAAEGALVNGALAAAESRGAVAAAEAAAKRTVSSVEDVTISGSKLPNIKTDVPKSEFEKNLIENGFSKSTSKDGLVNILTKGDKKYSTRDFSKSTDGPTAETFINNVPVSKIRLGNE
jgi:RHS repeat-associated protein